MMVVSVWVLQLKNKVEIQWILYNNNTWTGDKKNTKWKMVYEWLW